MLIYDCEIKKAIVKKGESKIANIEYCDGFRDFANMGISVICAYSYVAGRYAVFMEDNLDRFQSAVRASLGPIVSFNGLGFDNKLCAANGIDVPDKKTYDLLVEIWRGLGLAPAYDYKTHNGFGLEAMGEANVGRGKTGNGAMAPVDWQQGKIGRVVSYCLDDVALTKALLDRVIQRGCLINPKDKTMIPMRRPG